jgi:hypothetical protein
MNHFFLQKNALLALAATLLISCKPSHTYSEDKKGVITKLYKIDQEIQYFNQSRLEDQKYLDSMNLIVKKVFAENCLVVKEYFNENSFPGIKENGKEIALQFWVIVQHSDHDVKFQEKVLRAMKRELKNNNVNARNFAYLFDRILKNKGKKQMYGTQISWETGLPTPLPLKYPEKLDEMRKEMGLEPISEYLASFLN